MIEKKSKDQESNRYGKIYFIGNGDLGPIKIGFSGQSDLKLRLGQLQTASPSQLDVLGFFDGYIKSEQKVHHLLASHRLCGEWFEREAALAVCNCICSKETMPDSKFVENLLFAAHSVHDPRKSSEENENEEYSLSFGVACDLLRDYYYRIKDCSPDQPLPLRSWLLSQTERDHYIGALARDVKCDSKFPAVASLPEYLEYMRYFTTNPAVTRAVIEAWEECIGAIRILN